MISWKCPKCGTLNGNYSTSACCVSCGSTSAYCVSYGSSKWTTVPTTAEPQTGTYFETPRSVCPDCTRKDKLITDLWEMYKPEKDKMYSGDLEMKARIKQEGIV